MSLIPLLLLADSRFPAHSRSHSGGLEDAVVAGRVGDAVGLLAFLAARLGGPGLTSAAFAAATVRELGAMREPVPGAAPDGPTGEPANAVRSRLALLDAEFEARTPSPAQRALSRALGAQLLIAAEAAWPGAAYGIARDLHPAGPHRPIALGAAAAAAGADDYEAAVAAAMHSVTEPADAAVELLGLGADEVTAILAALSSQIRAVAAAASRAGRGPVADLPAAGDALLDIAAERHSVRKGRRYES